MNERIKLLVEQAEDWADKQNFYESDYRDYLMEKFAELIVRECAGVAIDNGCGDFVDIKQKLFEHFGVEQ
jgi:hypothetical protein